MLEIIKNIKPEEMSDVLMAVQRRFHELYPDWELIITTLEKNVDKNEQLDRIIALTEKMKEF